MGTAKARSQNPDRRDGARSNTAPDARSGSFAIYDLTTTRYREAGSPVDRRHALADWAVLIEELLSDHPQSAYFPGASLQLAAHHSGIFNRSWVRQPAEAQGGLFEC